MVAGHAAGEGEIRSAGAVLWRPGMDGPQVALVHRPKYGDWSLPKGKCEPGEHVLLTAVREVAEETGIRVILGRRLPSTRYTVPSGRLKVVDYWAAKAADVPQPGFIPNQEVDRLEWLDMPAAQQRLSYPRDTVVLGEFAAGPPDTVPLVLTRHASAGSKTEWREAGHTDDLARPLDPAGHEQAGQLALLLRCYGQARVFSSAAARCAATVRPYATEAGMSVQQVPAFTVGHGSASEARHRTDEILAGALPAVLCLHRENLPVILEGACAVLGAKPPDGGPLPLAGFWVLHIGWNTLACAERHHAPAR
ncbi:MAG TPA: NUDIX hydrolase [Streptosporangiaceae bacterium]|nr:NUDIX hydrolase [Streptosporangiaceae bacterium]